MRNFGSLFSRRSDAANRLRGEIEILRESPLLDPVWYRNTYPDFRDAPVDAARHYLEYGAREGRDPSPLFNTKLYLNQNPEVASSGMNPLVHYLRRGQDKPGPADVTSTFAIAAEIRQLLELNLFDEAWYLRTYPDVDGSVVNPLEHFCVYGWKEGKNPNQFFDTSWFAKKYLGSRLDENPVLTYALDNWRRGYSPSLVFDGDKYLEEHQDVRRADVNPLVHYLTYGRREGRRIFAVDEGLRQAVPSAPSLVRNPGLVGYARHFLSRGGLSGASTFNSSRLNVHFIVPDFSPGGGGHTTIFRFCRLLELSGHSVSIWILGRSHHHDASAAHMKQS